MVASLSNFSKAMETATQAPVIDAVRVPPSACSTSQSIQTVLPLSLLKSTTARSDRPHVVDGAAGGGHGYDLAWLKEAVKERHVQAQNWWENKDVKAAVAKGNTEEW